MDDLTNPAYWIKNFGPFGILCVIIWRCIVFIKPYVIQFAEAQVNLVIQLTRSDERKTAILQEIQNEQHQQATILNDIYRSLPRGSHEHQI